MALSLLVSVLIFVFRDKFSIFQSWGYLGIFVLNLVSSASIFIPTFPGVVSALVGGSVFNPFLVGLAAALGASIGEMTAYLVGLGGGELIKEDRRAKKIEGWMEKHGLWVIFFLSAVPSPFFDFAGFIAGASAIPIYKFLLVVFAGKIIRYMTVSLIGYGFL